MHLVEGKTVDLNLSFIYIILIGYIQPGAMPIAVIADSIHSLTDTVCLTLLPQCYAVREEKQHLQDLIIN